MNIYTKTIPTTLVALGTLLSLTACIETESRQEAKEKANLKKATYCMEVLEVELDVERAGRECFGETYIQHSQHVPDGKDGVLKYFKERFEKYPSASMEIKRAGADDDLVWIHLHFKREPEARGSAVIHIFRMKDGKFVEHWGVGQPVPETSVHGNSMF